MKFFTTSPLAFVLLVSSTSAARVPLTGYEILANLQTISPTAISNFFSFQVYTGDNGGVASYVSQADATAAGIFYANRTTGLRFGVDMTPKQTLRKSVRLLSKASYNGGLFIFDVKAMPVGLGFWPALWMVGPNWPAGGEIDIIEGVHNTTQNTLSTHTSPGCYQGTSGFSGSFALAGSDSNNCDAVGTNDQGCGVRSPYTNSFGAPFNANGGGVYALLWDSTGLATYFFPRGSVPSDITATNGIPNPAGWGTPANYVSSANCNTSTFFKDMQIVINTDVCGSWPDGVWTSSLSYAGETKSPAEITGYATCEAYQAASPTAIHQWWEINAIRIYQKV